MGKAYYYKAVTRSRLAFRTMLGDLVDSYCGGSIQALVMNIIKSERLSKAELLKLKKLADESDPTPPPHKRRRQCARVSAWLSLIAGPAADSIGFMLVMK